MTPLNALSGESGPGIGGRGAVAGGRVRRRGIVSGGRARFAILRPVTLLVGLFCMVSAAGSQIRNDLFITNLAMDSLDATTFAPTTPAPPAGYPGILFVHGFGGSKNDDTANGRINAAAGYMTLCYSVRGHGASTGGSHIMSGPERSDLGTVMGFFHSMTTIDTNNIGISGGSQGGLHGLWAIADRLPVAAMSSDAIVPEWAADMLMNGSIRRTVVLLLKSSRVRYAPVRDTLWEYVRNDRYGELLAAFPPGRDVDTADLNSGTVPSLRFLKWQDHYFTASDGIAAFRNYAGPKKLYLGTLGHFSDQAESEKLYQYDQVTRWLAHYLKGANNGIDSEPVYTYAASTLPMDSAGYFSWERTGLGDWPPPGVQPYRLYLSPDSSLTFSAPSGPGPPLFVQNLHVDSAYTFDTGYIEGFRGPVFEQALPKSTVAFESPPLPWDVEWVGAPRMELNVSSPDGKFPLHAQIYEIDASGTKYFINRINYTARNWPGGAGVVDAAGIAHAHRFHGGSRIRVELTNIDVTNRIELGSYPFVLPVFDNAAVTIYADALRPSYIELPLAQSPTGVQNAGIPPTASPRLLQNYPNPFNGATTFEIRLRSAGEASLVVYNTLGQVVDRLIDSQLEPGRHTVRWEAGRYPTGVYFARLSVTPQTGGGKAVSPVVKLMLMR